MKRTLIALAATGLVSACASTPAPVAPAPTPASAPDALLAWNAANAAYLEWNAEQRGWTTTESGLQYRRQGRSNAEGRQPGATDTVQVHYEGRFIDGRVFDSSYERGEPTEFPLNRVIAGWTEGVALMREGETYDFVIPSSLAYGERWVGGGELPPNSTLRFKVELLAVK